MAQLVLGQTRSSLALVATVTFLASCGGSSQEESNRIASSGSSSSLYSELHLQQNDSPASERVSQHAVPPSESLATASVITHSTHTLSSSPEESSNSSASEGPTGQDPNAFTLTFHDSFDGDLDHEVWNINSMDRTEASDSITNYATNNGSLKIWPERDQNGQFFKRTFDTKGRFSQQYGYFEVEAKLPRGNGAWPAFWLLNMDGERRPELDIMEAYPGGVPPWGAPDAEGIPTARMYGVTLWRDNKTDQTGFAKVPTPDLSEGFHRYGAKWEPNKVTFYFDGEEVYSVDAALPDPMFMIVNLWFGSASGEPDSSTPTGVSNAYEINYVKAWQFK